MPDTRGFDLIAELPDDGTRQKEVYARFGLVAFKAQVFDHALVNLLTFAGMIDGDLTAEQIDQYAERLFAKTAGALVNDATASGCLAADDVATCRAAVAERNRLIHRFFREHAENFMYSTGQQRMLDDLGVIADLIQAADEACQRIVMTIAAPYGLTEEMVEEHLATMQTEILRRNSTPE